MNHPPENHDMALGAIKKLSGLQQIHLVSLVQQLEAIQWQRIGSTKRRVLKNLRDIRQAVDDVTPIRDKLKERLNFYPSIAGRSELIQKLTDQVTQFLEKTGFEPAVTRAREVYVRTMQELGADTSNKAKWILQHIRHQKKKDPKDVVFRTLFIKDIRLDEMSLEEVTTMATEKTAEILPNLEVETLKGGLCLICEQVGHIAISCNASMRARLIYVESREACNRCLSRAHKTLECKSIANCGTCGGLHHTALCIPQQQPGKPKAEDKPPCPYCAEDHRATQCPLPSQSKRILLNVQKRCRRCLTKNHQQHLCRKDTLCKICNNDHHYTNCDMIEDAVTNATAVNALILPPDQREVLLEKQRQREYRHLILTTAALKKITKPWTLSPCRYCNSSNHNAENCPEDIQDKQIAIVSKKLCGICLSSQHTMDECHQQLTCKKCGDNHLHMHCDEPEKQEPTIKGHEDNESVKDYLMEQLQSFQITDDQGSEECISSSDHPMKKKPTSQSTSTSEYNQFSGSDSDSYYVDAQESLDAEPQRGNMLELQEAIISPQEEVTQSHSCINKINHQVQTSETSMSSQQRNIQCSTTRISSLKPNCSTTRCQVRQRLDAKSANYQKSKLFVNCSTTRCQVRQRPGSKLNSTQEEQRLDAMLISDEMPQQPDHSNTSGIFHHHAITQEEASGQDISTLTATHMEEDCQTIREDTADSERDRTVVERLKCLIAFQSSNLKYCQSYVYLHSANNGQESLENICQTRHALVHGDGRTTPVQPSYAAQEAITFLHASKGRWNVQEVLLLHSPEDILSNQSIQSSINSQAQQIGTRIWFKQIHDIPSPDQSTEEIDTFIVRSWTEFQLERHHSSMPSDLSVQAGPGNEPFEERLSASEQLRCTPVNSSNSEKAKAFNNEQPLLLRKRGSPTSPVSRQPQEGYPQPSTSST